MQIKRMGNVIAVVSTIPVEAIEDAKKMAPSALVVKDDKGNDVYKVGFAEEVGALKPYVVIFNTVSREGLATLTLQDTDANLDDVRTYYGAALAALAKYEAVVVAQIEANLGPINDVINSIEDVQI